MKKELMLLLLLSFSVLNSSAKAQTILEARVGLSFSLPFQEQAPWLLGYQLSKPFLLNNGKNRFPSSLINPNRTLINNTDFVGLINPLQPIPTESILMDGFSNIDSDLLMAPFLLAGLVLRKPKVIPKSISTTRGYFNPVRAISLGHTLSFGTGIQMGYRRNIVTTEEEYSIIGMLPSPLEPASFGLPNSFRFSYFQSF